MNRDDTLKYALIMSLVLHFGVVFPWMFLRSKVREEKCGIPEGIYTIVDMGKVVIEKEVTPDSEDVAEEEATRVNDVKMPEREDAENKETIRPPEEMIPPKEALMSSKGALEPEKGSLPVPETPKSPDATSGNSSGEPYTEEERKAAYTDYFDSIRDKIKRSAAGIVKTDHTGDVEAVFTIAPDGELLRIDDVISPEIPTLASKTIKSIRKASPFPPFPAEIGDSPITFSLKIKFTAK
jgi:protein TonB